MINNQIMKAKFLLFSFLLVTALAFAQSSAQIPTDVKSTFDRFYPNAQNVNWQQEQSYFIPVFTDGNVRTKLLIDLKGALIHTSVHISDANLPATATAYITATYPGQVVSDAEKLTMFNHSNRYEAIVAGKDLIFDSNGTFIREASGPLKQ